MVTANLLIHQGLLNKFFLIILQSYLFSSIPAWHMGNLHQRMPGTRNIHYSTIYRTIKCGTPTVSSGAFLPRIVICLSLTSSGSRYFVPQYFNQPVARILRLNLPSDQRSKKGIAIVKICINYVVKPSALEVLPEHHRKVLTGGISLNIMLVTFSDV